MLMEPVPNQASSPPPTAHVRFLQPVADKKLYPKLALALLTALNLLNYIDRSVLFAVQDMVKAEFHRSDLDFRLDHILHRKQDRAVKAEFHRSDLDFGFLTSVFFIFYM